MAGNKGNPKDFRVAQGMVNADLQVAPPGLVSGCPILLPAQGNLAIPCQNFNAVDVAIDELVEGGPSICRDGDPPPLLPSFLGGDLVPAAAAHCQTSDALKVAEESPERKLLPEQSVSSGFVADLHCSLPPKTGPMRSYANVVSNPKEYDEDAKSKKGPADSRRNFVEAKTSFHKSFYENDVPCNFGHISEIEGHKVVSFSIEELDELATPFEFTLVGKFSHGFPTMKILKFIMGNLNLKGSFSIALLEHKHVLIRLSCEDDYTRLWSRQVWFMAGFPMRILKWTPDFDPLVESPFAPVWVLFPYLPVHLFDKRSLFQIASVIGKPLRIDSATAALTRPSTPRVCIEIDVTQASLPEIEIRLGGKIRMQPVEYENMPSYCLSCKHLGHNMESCKSFNKPSSVKFDNDFLDKPIPMNEVPAAVRDDQCGQISPSAPDQPSCQVSRPLYGAVLEDSISLDSTGLITFTPGLNNPTSNPVNVHKIKMDLYHSLQRFDDDSGVEADCRTICNESYYRPSTFVGKNSFSDGDCPKFNSEPILLPKKKKIKKKVKAISGKHQQAEERVVTIMMEPDESAVQRNEIDMEFQTVVSKKRQKGEKSRKKQENCS